MLRLVLQEDALLLTSGLGVWSSAGLCNQEHGLRSQVA